MKTIYKTIDRKERYFWFSIVSLSSALGLLLWVSNDGQIRNLIFLAIGFIFTIIVVRFPIYGFGFVLISSNIAELLPKVPLLSSVSPLVGLLTLIAFLLRDRRRSIPFRRFTTVEVLGFILIIWIFVSNPAASIFGSSRSWIITFIQLWVFLWMAKHFLSSEKDHLEMMWVILAGIFISALIAIQQVVLSVGTIDRVSGLSGGPNTIARFCVYGIILLSYLQSRFKEQPVRRLLILVGIPFLIITLFYTGSRTGLLLLGVAMVFVSQRYLVGRQRSLIMWLILVLGVVWVLNQVSGSNLSPTRMLDAIFSGSDTVGVRYRYWQAGWVMWLDHPIVGVGIGQFSSNLLAYWNYFIAPTALTPHNTYIQVLSETGIIGFIIFIAFISVAIIKYYSKIKTFSESMSDINWTWLIILLILLVGGITKTDLLEKFLWFLIGLSASEA